MKKAAFSSVFMALCLLTIAQVPESFSYQVVVREGTNPLTNQNVSFKMSILKGSSSGESQYSELHSANTGALGIVNLVIGNGTDKTGDFASIEWGADTYYLKVEIDKTGGSGYVEMGTTQLLTVPYAMYAKSADYNSLLNKPTIINSQWTSSGSDIYYNAGKVGIGTNPGDYILTVDGRATLLPGEDGTAGILYKTAENNNIGFIGAAGDNRLGIWGSGGGGFGMVMDVTSLNVGIGTSAPATKLEVNGVITASGANITGTTTVSMPVNPTDAANKAYVDVLLEKINRLELLAGVEESVTDYDGNTYEAIRIGTQVWMTENLRSTHRNDGTEIALVTSSESWSSSYPCYCWYLNDESTYAIYGPLYNWHTVNTGNLCPAGWHVPSHPEWATLVTFLGGATGSGGKLKEAGTAHWLVPNTGATNETHFAGLPSGYRSYTGTFGSIETNGYFWSSTESSSSNAWVISLSYGSNDISMVGPDKRNGYSVRCIKD